MKLRQETILHIITTTMDCQSYALLQNMRKIHHVYTLGSATKSQLNKSNSLLTDIEVHSTLEFADISPALFLLHLFRSEEFLLEP